VSAAVRAPDGAEWTVERRWIRRRPRWRRRKDRDGGWDIPDLGGLGDDPVSAVVAVVVAVVVAIVLLVFLVPVLFFLLDLLLFVVLAAGVGVVGMVFGRPWRIEVRGPAGPGTVAVRGWRASNHVIAALRDSIARTGRPHVPTDVEARWV
jgi:hypothetical protein